MGVNSLPWYLTEAIRPGGKMVSLAGEEWHHCFHVLRMSVGESLVLFDGKGQCFEGIIRSTSKNEGHIELIRDLKDAFPANRPYKLSIGMALTKNMERTEFAVEKMVELGVDEICFLDCEHSERSRVRIDRIYKLVLGAAKQSRKILIPQVKDLVSPEQLIPRLRKIQPGLEVYCCHLDSNSTPLPENFETGKDVLMLIGPEGGFSSKEIKQMTDLQARLVTLSPFRLRVETAAITACAAIHLLNQLNISK